MDEVEITLLQTENELFREKLLALETKITELNRIKDSCEKQVQVVKDEKEKSLKDLSLRIQKKQQKLDGCKHLLKSTEDALTKRNAEIKNKNATLVSQIQKYATSMENVARLQDEIIRLQDEIIRLQDEIIRLKDEIIRLERVVNDNKDEIEILKKAAKRKNLVSLRRALNHLEDKKIPLCGQGVTRSERWFMYFESDLKDVLAKANFTGNVRNIVRNIFYKMNAEIHSSVDSGEEIDLTECSFDSEELNFLEIVFNLSPLRKTVVKVSD